jgi:hypothetical protein
MWDNKVCYKASYRDITIWYNQNCSIGCINKCKNNKLIPINELKSIIDAFIDGNIILN